MASMYSKAMMRFNFMRPLIWAISFVVLSGCAQVGQAPMATKNTEPAREEPFPSIDLTTLGENPYLQTLGHTAPEVQQRFEVGQRLMTESRWQAAQEHWAAFVQDVPRASGGYLNLGITLAQQGDYKSALEMFEQGILANKKNLDLYNQSGLLLRKMGDFKAAEAHYKAGLSQWQGYAPLHLNLAILYEIYLGRPDAALYHYEQYQRLLDEPDKVVSKWVIDLQRRVTANASEQ